MKFSRRYAEFDVRLIRLAVAFLLLLQTVSGQSFVNLNFESARGLIPRTPANTWGGFVDPILAFPGWTIGGNYTVVGYNTLSLGALAVILMGPNFPNAPGYTPLEGLYSTLLEYFGYPSLGPATLSQTALVPAYALSMNFLAGNGDVFNGGGVQVFLGGVPVPLFSIGGGRLAADVSAFSGTVSQLTFSGNIYIDDIQLSPTSVPEPNSFFILGAGLFFLRCRAACYSKIEKH